MIDIWRRWRRGGSGRLRRFRDGGELYFRGGNGRFGFGHRRRSGRYLRAGLLCRGFRLCRFDLHRLCRLQRRQFLGLGWTSVRGLPGRCRGINGCFRNCGGGDILRRLLRDRRIDAHQRQRRRRAVIAAGKPRLGRHPSRGKVGKFLMRGTQQGGGAEAKNQDRHRKHDRGEQETKAGKHGREFHPLLMFGGLLMPRERGDHCAADSRGASARRIRPI